MPKNAVEKKRESEKRKKKQTSAFIWDFCLKNFGENTFLAYHKRVQICGVKEEMLKSVWVFVMKRGSCLSLQSLWSQDTQAVGVLIFSPEKIKKNQKKEEEEAPALATKIFPASFVAGIMGNVSRGSIKTELQRRRQSRSYWEK